MNILHVVNSLDPADGGPPAVAERLAAAQAVLTDEMTGKPHRVTLVSRASPGREAQVQASLDPIPHMDQVSLVSLPPDLTFGIFVPPATSRQLRESIAQADIVHLHGVWDRLLHRAAIEAMRLRKPYVLTPHGMLDPWSLQQRWLKKKVALMLAYRKMLQRARCLHVLNEDEARLIKPLKLTPPAQVIPNGVFLEEIEPHPPAGSFYAKHPELEGDPFVLFLSRLHYKKGLDYLADAFAIALKSLPHLRLVVAGPDGGAQADFEAQIDRLGIASRVHLVGPLWAQDKYAAMVDAACFCLPSRQEGFSVAITEALATGTPAVVSEGCHFPEVAAAGAGEVVPLDAQAVAAALVRVLSDESQRQQMGRAGRELVLSRFTWPVIAQQAVQMYRNALGHHNNSPALAGAGKGN